MIPQLVGFSCVCHIWNKKLIDDKAITRLFVLKETTQNIVYSTSCNKDLPY